MIQDPTEFRVVALVNKALDPGLAMNAIAHLGMGLASIVGDSGREVMQFLDFADKTGGVHPSISARSLIVLRGSSNDIRSLRAAARGLSLPCVDFISTMTSGDFLSQLARTRETAEDDIDYWGIAILGRSEDLKPLTRKYSLWR